MEGIKTIQFLDGEYNEMFRLLDGEKITITYADGKQDTAICDYIDETHFCLTIDDSGRAVEYDICEFALHHAIFGNTYEPTIPQKYKLEPITEVEAELVSAAKGKERGCIGVMKCNFGVSGNEFNAKFVDEAKHLRTNEFNQEFADVLQYFRCHSTTPLLKNPASLRYVCYTTPSYNLDVAFMYFYVFKAKSEKHTYYFRCCTDSRAYHINMYCYNNEQLQKYMKAKENKKPHKHRAAER